ncbi:MAG: glycyl-radical enzyme activating protein [Peptoniphilus sp.]|uniref:Glycyl-radical enzyme activating protein n=1 Tax=Peptoniphilus porci TaxID=2652280 RepID=A0A1U7M1K2_9FIRM|nr:MULTISPECIES: glycyl-radical enzyme activating protein [Peptoniphilus]MCI5642839.1 glycyl-radical enzyme activating protein [Peptoniphilus sp.]MDD7353229.1 glycyl-radical enzyme activating protein [Peptoniphilaceae bacterium]MDY3903150.1 glycyl-radical enzyme activating protein [Peptoniphilus sp.]OLR65529.1 glycyl-radical enzyme activating protein [Peptoniphilus porci]
MDSINYNEKGVVFDIQRYSINDGPGIRTIVFLKGCPLRCIWCSNPESQRREKELMFRRILCIHCGLCIKACKQGALDANNLNFIDRDKCIMCEECANVCPSSALEVKGKEMTVAEVIEELKKDEKYYISSNGGVTLSGGEAMMQVGFAKEIFRACKARGWHTAIETEGYVSEEAIREVIPHVDLVLLDMKANNDEIHKKATGVSNKLIKKNAMLIQSLSETIIRVPTVPGVNADMKEFGDIVSFVKTLPNVRELHILPYHNYGEGKYYLLGRDYELSNLEKLDNEYVDKLKKFVESNGLVCQVGG